MADYKKQIATARRLISKKGMKVVFVQKTVSEELDPYGRPTYQETRRTVKAVKSRPTTDELEAGYPSESLILLVAGNSFTNKPTTPDKFEFNGHIWDINQIIEVAPAKQVILYKFVLLEKGEVE